VGSEPHISLEKIEKKNEKDDDLVMTTSQHDIGENLSKYDHFLSREDIMSPLKQANPSKLIYETIPNILLEQFTDLIQAFEKKGHLEELMNDKENEEWELIYKEEYLEKNFRVLMNLKSKNRGKIIIDFNDKTPQEIFAVRIFEFEFLLNFSLNISFFVRN